MNRNQKLALIILLVMLVVLVGSAYLIYQSQNEEEDYYGFNQMREDGNEVIVDTSYGPVDFVTVDQNSEEDTSVIFAEQMPEFPGGQDGMMKFLDKNLQYPQQAKEQGIQGKVWVSFVVDKTGKVKNVELEKGIGGGCDEEAMRVIRKMPKWKPGRQDGKPVNVKFRFPLNFTLR